MKKKKECDLQAEVSKEDLRELFEGSLRFFFEFELACLSPSIFCYSMNILCLLRNEGVPSFRLCASLFL